MLAGFLFKEYEMNQEGVVTGYQVMLENEQVATLEYRSHTWIGAIVKDINIITKRDQSVMRVAGWIIHELRDIISNDSSRSADRKGVRQKEKKFFSLTNLYRILTSRPFLDFVE